jgi:hypothetical protein
MSEVRWIARLGAPLVVASLAFAASGAPPGLGLVSLTAPAARALAACPPGPDAGGAPAHGAARPPAGRRAWFTLTERMDARGTLVGWRFRSGPLATPPTIDVEVGPESFAEGPDDGIAVLGRDDGATSVVDVIDVGGVGSGCSRASATSRDVIRDAIRDAATGDVFVHRLDRLTRADLGVVRIRGDRLAGGAAVDIDAVGEPAVPPLPADERFGATWATRMLSSTDGRTLAIQSCGATACRTRLLDVATGGVTTVDEPPHGELVGLVDGALVAWAACDGLPCQIVRIDAATGATGTLSDAATAAVLVGGDGRPRIVVEEPRAGGWTLALVDPADATRRTLASPNGLKLRPHRGGRTEGAELPNGWLRLVPADSSGPAWGTDANAGLLLRTDDARTADPATDPTEVR